MLTLSKTVHLSGPLHRRATCCIDTSKSGSVSAGSAAHRVLLAASKHKRGSGSDGAKEQNAQNRAKERPRHGSRECTRPRLLPKKRASTARGDSAAKL